MNDYIAECLEKFQDLPETFKEAVGGFEACAKLKEIEDKHQGISLGFVTVLLAVGELGIADLPEYLKIRFEIKEDEAKKISAELDEQILAPAMAVAGQGSYEPTHSVEEVEDIFKQGVMAALSKDNDSLKVLNADIFRILNDHPAIEDDLGDNLRKNQERVSKEKIKLGDREVPGTIANWIADFIARYGTDQFDELEMAQYLSSSENVNLISAPEKNNLRRILRLYYNFIFFPDSMEGVPVEKWEVFPLDVLNDLPSEPESQESGQIFQLRQALSRYIESSLEYKAISEEIRKLEGKKR